MNDLTPLLAVTIEQPTEFPEIHVRPGGQGGRQARMINGLDRTETRGAGDSMTAGVAAVLATGGDIKRAVRTGAAAGALNVTRHGLGTGRRDAIVGLVDRVRLVPAADQQDRTTPDVLAHRTIH